ncbi:hypothetical protein PAXRUDRAFT_17013 [Paxillus rubicundulus Ve08.2h10]|uniref:Uncharacterized protein n=1 Tax=Paxillus rubicundulus Ve08.2h10 TaxID=930991 RepID=A0A0D0D3R2_9AGAM|nr:hypothetical protein PAXRUDRAFT_17013 [Paxillus rubicundulus Ve08.2h10]
MQDEIEAIQGDVTLSAGKRMSFPMATESEPGQHELPITQLWEEFKMECTMALNDYFVKMQELGVETDEHNGDIEEVVDSVVVLADHGIDIQDVRMTSHHASKADFSPSAPLYPWKSESEFVTHLLFSSPCLHFSDAKKSALLEWVKALGPPDVPSMYAVKKTQERIQKLLGNPMEKISMASDNTFYLNAISKAIAMITWKMDKVKCRKFIMETRFWKVFQMILPHHARQGGYFIPKKFFQARLQSSKSVDAEVLALGHKVSLMGEWFSVDLEMVITPASTFFHTFKDIQHESSESDINFTASSAAHAKLIPNPLQIKSGGQMVITVPLIVFMDDVSGNISKQWNKHHVIYMSNALMPCEMLKKEFCIWFVSSSPHATLLELMQGLKESIQKAVNDPIIAFDVKYQEEVMLIPYDLFLVGDNPMQAEECSHGGLKCNYFCHTCKVGGMNVEKKIDKGYMNIFKANIDYKL